MYKKSKYTYLLKNPKGDYIVFNSLNGKMMKILKNDVVVKYLMTNSSDFVPKKFLDNGFIIPESMDEDILLSSLYNNRLRDSVQSLCILPTEVCNFGCPYCFENSSKKKNEAMSNETQEAIIKYVRENIKYHSSLYVGWFGGEPLLGLDVIKNLSSAFVEICRFYRKNYFSVLITNGYFLTSEVYNELKKFKITEIGVTLDGLAESHDKQRPLKGGQGTFEKIINNLLDIKDHTRGNIKIIIRTNVSDNNVNKMRDYIVFLENKFSSDKRFSVYFSPIYDMNNCVDNDFKKELINTNEIELTSKLLDYFEDVKFFCKNWVENRLTPNMICPVIKPNNYVFSSDNMIYKCSTLCQHDVNMNLIGSIMNGTVEIDEYQNCLWDLKIDETDLICKNCIMKPICFHAECAAHIMRSKYDQNYKNQICCRYGSGEIALKKLLLLADKVFEIEEYKS